MAYPGTWQQLGNFEARGQRINYDGFNQAATADVPEGDRSGDPAADMTSLLGEIDRLPYSGTSTATGEAFFGATLSPRRAAPAVPSGRAHKSLLTLRVAPVSLTPPSSIIPPAPEGSVGYEWQATDGTVTGGHIQIVSLQASGSTDGVPAGSEGDWTAHLGLAPDTGTVPMSYAEATLVLSNGQIAQWQQGSNPAIDGTADIGAFVDAAGRFQVLGEASASVTAFNDAAAEETSWNGSLRAGIRTDDQVLANTIWVFYSVRPPLFRWLYATPQAPPILPPLRTVQRGGDGLGASSAPRAVQRRTRQATNRAVSCF